jgi:hypothetical protein
MHNSKSPVFKSPGFFLRWRDQDIRSERRSMLTFLKLVAAFTVAIVLLVVVVFFSMAVSAGSEEHDGGCRSPGVESRRQWLHSANSLRSDRDKGGQWNRLAQTGKPLKAEIEERPNVSADSDSEED